MYKSLPFIFAITAWPPAALAQVQADTTVELPPAVIEAQRSAGSAETPVHLSIIAVADLEASQVRTVADVLDRRSSANVIRYGPSGFSTASFRGLGGKHTEIFLDGLLVSDPQANQIDLSVIPLVMVESIEITHGPGSAARGTGSLGGAIALNTLRAGDRPRLKLGLDAGAYGQRRLGAAAAGQNGLISLTFAGELTQYDGDYPYTNPTLINPTERVRQGADKNSTSAYVNAALTTSDHRISASAWFNAVERGLPGPGNASPVDARQWDDHLRAWLSSEHRMGRWNGRFSFMADRADLRYANATVGTDETTSTSTTELQGSLGRTIGSGWLLTAGLSAGFDGSSGISETRMAAYTDAIAELGRVTFYPSARLENRVSADRKRTFLVPRAGVNFRLTETGSLRLKANAGRAYRPPSFLERFWKPGGNPLLEPETGWSVDFGALAMQGSDNPVQAEVTLFRTDLQNQIAWFPSLVGSGVQVWRPFNVGRVTTSGAELSVSAVKRFSRLAANPGFTATFSRALDRSDPSTPSYGNQLRYTPEFTVTAFVDVTWKPVSVTVTARHVGKRFITSDESQSIDRYGVLDAGISYEIVLPGASKASISAQVDNVLDADYSVIRFYPMPPRSVTFRFGIDLTQSRKQ